ncbi:MAG: DUF748 domain-containing protein [Psychromonas sp.]
MNPLKKLFSRQFYRSVPFWFLFLLTLYSVIGFFVLPKVIDKTIREQVTANLGWQTEIKSVQVNPFLLTLTIEKLLISDAEIDSISFSRFHADFELRSIIEGAYTFKNITLLDPSFNIIINKDGSTNIQQALAAHQKPDPTPVKATPFVMPKLLFDNIVIKNGALSAHDHSQATFMEHKFNPINFNLRSFSTYIDNGGDYQLHVSLDNDQSLQWTGNISVSPISSQGSFNIKGIKLAHFWPYIEALSPYQLRRSQADLQANYSLSYIDNHFQLQLNDAFVMLRDIQLATHEKTKPFVNIEKITIGPTDFDLTKQSVSIKKVAIDSLNLDLLRTKNGELELLTTLETFLAKQPKTQVATVEDTSTPPFQWSIDKISIANSALQITDKSVTGGAKIKVHHISAELSQLNHTLANKQPFSLLFKIANSQENQLSGQLTAQPFSLTSQIKLSAIPINIIQPYLTEIAHINIENGALSLNAKTQLAMHDKKGLSGKFNGSMGITDFESHDTLMKRRLLGWKNLAVNNISVNLSPIVIDIKEVTLNKPYARLVVTEDRKINFSQLMIPQPLKKTAPKSASSGPEPKIAIHKITIKQGGAYFADLSLRPQFGTSIQQLNGTIKGLSSNNRESAEVNINGTVEEYGKVSVKGKINPLSDELYTDININFDKIELTTMTPYSGRYAGYVIDKGKLSLALKYKIANGKLDGSNRLILDQFELGDAVDSDESLNLPLKLALALFKDSNGIIDISLPTKGDINSPDFEISGLIMKALVNVITKAITSPFSLLANLAGGSEPSLNAVSFELGSATLDSEQQESLKTLASLLIQRPQLILEIRVNVDDEQDLRQLKIQALTAQLALKNKEPSQQLSAMETLLEEKQGDEALERIQESLQVAQEKAPVEQQVFDQQYQQALFEQLLTLQPITSLQLSELAQQRISVIKNELIKVNKVANQQIFALHPLLTGTAKDNIIETIFTLTTK